MKSDIYEKIVDVAETFIQTKGYNAFSYRDIAELVGVKTSSIHYYFPTKADLGKEVVGRYTDMICQNLNKVLSDEALSCQKKLELFFDDIFAKTYSSNQKMCLGGMLASDVLTLPNNIQKEVRSFFKRLEDWLEQLLLLGKKQKEFRLKRNARQEALLIISLLEGALLLARLYQDEERLTLIRNHIKSHLILE